MKHNLIFYDIEDETSFSVDEDSKHDIDFMMNLYSVRIMKAVIQSILKF